MDFSDVYTCIIVVLSEFDDSHDELSLEIYDCAAARMDDGMTKMNGNLEKIKVLLNIPEKRP